MGSYSLCTEVPGRTKRASGSPQVRTEDGNLVLSVNKLSHVSVKVGSDSVNLDEISADCDAKVAAVSASLTESVEQAAADVVKGQPVRGTEGGGQGQQCNGHGCIEGGRKPSTERKQS